MKKQLLLLTAGAMLVLASCKNEVPVDAGASQAQIDSIVNARVEEMRAELMAQNDSLINALAQWKADSMIAAMKGAKPAAAKPAPKPKPVTSAPAENVPAKPAAPANPKDARFGGEGSTGKSKDARFNEDAQKKEQENNAGKKADRFK